jgi:hypothetical protein
MENKDKITIMGMWKFDRDNVSREEVVELAKEWAEDENYVQLYVRGGGNRQTALGFTYETDDEDMDKDNGYFKKTYDILLKKYGIGVRGYDISNTVTKIKGF